MKFLHRRDIYTVLQDVAWFSTILHHTLYHWNSQHSWKYCHFIQTAMFFILYIYRKTRWISVWNVINQPLPFPTVSAVQQMPAESSKLLRQNITH